MREFRVQLFPQEQRGFKAAIKGIFGEKSGLKEGEKLELRVGRLTKYGYNCVDVFRKGKRIGEVRRKEIDEMIEKGAFKAAHYVGYMNEVPQIKITCLEPHEYGDKPEYKVWREKIKNETRNERDGTKGEFLNSLKESITKLSKTKDPVQRHFHYQHIVEKTYKLKKDPKLRSVCKKAGLKYISNFDSIAPLLKKEFNNKLPRIITFKYLPKLLSEDGDHSQAIEICKKAIGYKLEDGTKGGFPAMLKRLEKKRDSDIKKPK